MLRNPELFSEQRVKQEFQRALDLCVEPAQLVAYLHAAGYYGCVGERDAITTNAQSIRDFVGSAQDAELLDKMYTLALNFFALHYAHPRSLTHRTKTVDGAFTLLLRPAHDTRLVEMGRVGSASDSHYMLRAQLYGFPLEQLRQWPLGGVYVVKCCHHCLAYDAAQFSPCRGCGDAFYCSVRCHQAARPGHASYCAESAKSQETRVLKNTPDSCTHTQ